MNNPTMTKPKATAHCRVVVTDECNLSCDFCCMNDEKIHSSFEDATAWYIAQQMHSEVSITGGEPLMALPRVIMFSQIVRYFNPDVKLWLYTNGELLTLETVRLLKMCGISGLNISIHNWDRINSSLLQWAHLREMMPIRILANEDEMNEEVQETVADYDIPLRLWKMDDCNDMPFESRYRLTEPDLKWS